VEINAVTFQWADLQRLPEGTATVQDIQNTLTHEFGHLIGLDHTCFISGGRPGAVDDQGRPVPSCAEASDEIRATTMFAAAIPGAHRRRGEPVARADDPRGQHVPVVATAEDAERRPGVDVEVDARA